MVSRCFSFTHAMLCSLPKDTLACQTASTTSFDPHQIFWSKVILFFLLTCTCGTFLFSVLCVCVCSFCVLSVDLSWAHSAGAGISVRAAAGWLLPSSCTVTEWTRSDNWTYRNNMIKGLQSMQAKKRDNTGPANTHSDCVFRHSRCLRPWLCL